MNILKRTVSIPAAVLLCIAAAFAIWAVMDLFPAGSAVANAAVGLSKCELVVGDKTVMENGTVYDNGNPFAGVTYDPETNTLTLENTTIPSDPDNGTGGITYTGPTPLTIYIKGTVYLDGCDNITYYGERSQGTSGATVTVKGDGQSSSKLVQKPNSDGEAFFLFDFCSVDPEDDEPLIASRSVLDIEGLAIESTGGIDSDYTDISIKNCTWDLTGGTAPISMGRRDSAGNLTVDSSTIKMKAYMKSSYSPYAITCRSLTLNGVGLYAGASLSRLQVKLSPAGSDCSWNGYAAYQISPASQVQLWHKLTFNGNGGKAAYATKWVKAGNACGTLPKATKTHYTLAGWYTAKSGGTKYTASTKPSKAVTLYAHWKLAGKKKKVKLVKTIKAEDTYKVTYYKNGMIKKIKGGGSVRTFTYDDQLRYKKVTLYQSHYKKGKKPLFVVTFDYAKKKAKWKNNAYSDTWNVSFKMNKKGQFTYFNVPNIATKYTFKYNKKGYLVSEREKTGKKVTRKVTYKRSSKGLIRSVSYYSKDEGKYRAKFKYSMKKGVPKKYNAKVSSYNDKGTFKYKTKTVRDWQKTIALRQQKMLYYIDYSWGDALFVFI